MGHRTLLPPEMEVGGQVEQKSAAGTFCSVQSETLRLFFFQVNKALCLYFLQNDIKSAMEKLFPKQNHLDFSEPIFSFLLDETAC